MPELNMMYFWNGSCLHPCSMREHLAEMRTHGADSVTMQFTEMDEHESRRMRYMVDLAHDAGLRAYLMPGRVAGLFAAGPRPGSMFALRHPDTVMRDAQGELVVGISGMVCCVNQPAFQAWFYPFMTRMMAESGADGILFDEPKESEQSCWCARCRAMADAQTPAALLAVREQSMAAMLGRVSAEVKAQRSDCITIAMLMPIVSPAFIAAVAAQPQLDYLGVDGPLCRQGPDPVSNFIKEPAWESAPRYFAPARAAGRNTFVLAETFDVQPWACDELTQNITRLPALDADMYAFNYYGHDNFDPEAVMQQVWAAMALVKG